MPMPSGAAALNEWLTGPFLVQAQRRDQFRRGCGRERIGSQVEPLDVTGGAGVPRAAAAVTSLTSSSTTSRIQLRFLSSW